MKILTTLAESHYFNGLAALINSVIKQGTYIDKIIVGYRGMLPKWLPKLERSNRGYFFYLKGGQQVELIELIGDLHMVHEKPKWFKYLSEVLEPEADEYFFFDSDIVIINRMSFFGEWVREGVALCEDVNYDMNRTHPIRKQWERLVTQEGHHITNQLDRYINSGFLGWTKENRQFLIEWDYCFSVLKSISGDLTKFRTRDRSSIVLSANQDSLNITVMITRSPISIIGPEAMGFHYGFPLMQHPLGPKPWKRNFFKDFLRGKGPRNADLAFWLHARGELNPYKGVHVKRKIWVVKLFKLLGRFYSKK